ncbi:MAG: spermidine/putrescine transporter permease [Herbinix sp.]|jgi:multiple sugar transport system permease protein|nr:spermidine/putrescine transporter permease [Herbinix sp.]
MTNKQNNNVKRKRSWLKGDDLSGYLFIAVAMLIFIAFTAYPVFSAIKTSFFLYKPFGSEFVGLENYAETFTNSLFYKSVKNTIIYTIIVVPLSLVIAFSIAVMVMAFQKRTQSIFKAIYYLPGIASGVALSVVWLWLYDSSPSGLFNQILAFLGMPTQNWLNSSKTSMLSLIIMALASGQGSSVIIYVAALLGIDNSTFEAAELDGASFMQKIRYIVIPLVKPSTLFLFVTGIIGSFQVFMNAYMMTGGGPDNNTTMIGLLIFNNAFVYSKYGLACAQAIVLAIIIGAISFLQFKLMGVDVEY